MTADPNLIADLSSYLAQLAPHVAQRESASLMRRALHALQTGSTTPASLDFDAERRAFEHWFSCGELGCPSIRRSGGGYSLIATSSAWRVWQARALLSAQEGAA